MSALPDFEPSESALVSQILQKMNQHVPERDLIKEAMNMGVSKERAQQIIVRLYKNGVSNLLTLRIPLEEIESRLSALGAGPQTVRQIMEAVPQLKEELEAKEQARKRLDRDKGRKQLILGAAIFGIGIILTIGGYNAAEPGQTYTLFYGAILFGAVYMIIGLIRIL